MVKNRLKTPFSSHFCPKIVIFGPKTTTDFTDGTDGRDFSEKSVRSV